jgi:salicylate hydroxylase
MESRTTPDPPVAIIGGGLAGITYSMGPNALAALKEIDPRLREYLDSCATRNQDDEKSNSWLSFRHGTEIVPALGANVVDGGTLGFTSMIADVQALGPTEFGRSCVHRGTLIEKVACLVPEGIAEFGKQLIDEDLGTAVKPSFKDGTVAWASAVLACDGIKSMARRAMLRSDPTSIEPAFAGEYCYRRLVPMLEAQRILGDEMATNGNIFCGYNGYVTTYLVMIDNRKFVNMTAMRRQRDNAWPGADVWRQPCTTESMLQDFEGWGNPIIPLLKEIEKPEKWAPFDSRAAKTYAKGRVCLLGDAAHASTPHQGAGAGMASEDAYIITHLLRGAHGSQDAVGAFRVLDKIRWDRTQCVVETSRAAGQVFAFAHEGIMDNINSVRENLMV